MSATLGIGPAIGLLASGGSPRPPTGTGCSGSRRSWAPCSRPRRSVRPPGRDGHGGRVRLPRRDRPRRRSRRCPRRRLQESRVGWTDPRTLGSIAVGAMVLVAWCPFVPQGGACGGPAGRRPAAGAAHQPRCNRHRVLGDRPRDRAAPAPPGPAGWAGSVRRCCRPACGWHLADCSCWRSRRSRRNCCTASARGDPSWSEAPSSAAAT